MGTFGKKLIAGLSVLVIMAASATTAEALYVTSPFGWRVHPITGEHSFHRGLDIGADYGTPIPAMWAGEVVFASAWGGYGNAVIISHGNTVYTLYGHCSELYVQTGARVNQGQTIALVGSTGNSTGPHIHLELWRDNQYVNPMTIWQ